MHNSELLFGRRFREHQKVPIPCEEEGQLNSVFFKGRADKVCLQVSQDSIEFSYYIGIDWIGNKVVQVNPKLNDANHSIDYLQILTSCLQHPEFNAHILDIFEVRFDAPQIPINQSKDYLTPLLLISYLNTLQQLVKNGMKKQYVQRDGVMHSRVKGKVLVPQTIKGLGLKGNLLDTICRYEEFTVDHVENRVLKKALKLCIQLLGEYNIPVDETIINFIRPAFQEVSNQVSIQELSYSKSSPFYQVYDRAMEVALKILKRHGDNLSERLDSKLIHTPPFWIDMSLLFELFALSKLREVGHSVMFQYSEGYGAPDYLLPEKEIIADAKYTEEYKKDKGYWIDNVRQVSGYSRDKRIRRVFDAPPAKQIECLIIYPNQEDGYGSLKDVELKNQEIPFFDGFWKIGLKLPVIESRQD